MKGTDVLQKIREMNSGGEYAFISWWRREEDWLDFDLLERYLTTAKPEEEIGGFNLLTVEEMWQQVKRVCGERVRRLGSNGDTKLVWERNGQVRECRFDAKNLIDIFDVETRGQVIDPGYNPGLPPH